MSRVAASAASAWPAPVVSLPSDSSTIRFWASSGKSAVASRSAAPMSVAERTGVDAMRSISSRSRRQALDERLLAERDDARDVAVGDDIERLAQEGERILATGVADRVGQVHDEDGRQPVHRQDELEPGQGQDEGARAAACGRRARRDAGRRPPAGGRRGSSPTVSAMAGIEQEQRERGVERDAHQAVPAAAAQPGRDASVAAGCRPSRW